MLERWLPAIEGTVRSSTFSYHRFQITAHLVPNLGHILLQELAADDLQRCYAQLTKTGRRRGSGGLSPQSVRHVHASLRRALNDAVRWKLVPTNVALTARIPKVTQPEMKVWTPEQLRAFLEHVGDDRLYAAWLLACTTGLRRGEILGLTWSAVDLDRASLNVVKTLVVVSYAIEFSEPKTRKGRRAVALDTTTLEELKAHRVRQIEERLEWGEAYEDHEDHDLVFCRENGTPMHPENFTAAFSRHSADAGLPHIRPHDLRHSYATASLAAGIPVKVVSDRLGHANVGITSDLYMHVPDEMDRDAAERVTKPYETLLLLGTRR